MVFVLSLVKIIATLLCFPENFLAYFFSPSVPMMFVWTSDPFSVTLFTFKSDIWFALFGLYLLVWFVTPWLTISNKSVVKTVGVSVVLGINLFDIICCLLTALSAVEKIYNLFFSVLVICFSIWSIYRENRPSIPNGKGTRRRSSCLLKAKPNSTGKGSHLRPLFCIPIGFQGRKISSKFPIYSVWIQSIRQNIWHLGKKAKFLLRRKGFS